MELKNLQKFIKSTELVIRLIEDDSSENTKVLMLHLTEPIVAAGSIPIPGSGETAKLRSNIVHVADTNIDEFLKDCVEEGEGPESVVRYKGGMHLDVSKGRTRVNASTGAVDVITQPKIWLTATKFSRAGGKLQQNAQVERNKFLNKFFGGGKIAEVGITDATAVGAGDTPKVGEDGKVIPEVVAVNQ